jgi:hypothetical protein
MLFKEKNHCLHWKLYKIHKHKIQLLIFNADGTYMYQWILTVNLCEDNWQSSADWKYIQYIKSSAKGCLFAYQQGMKTSMDVVCVRNLYVSKTFAKPERFTQLLTAQI